jgi:signal transduction histidine kinase
MSGDAEASDPHQVEQALRAQKDLFANLVAVARATTEGRTLEATLQKTFDVLQRLTQADGGTLLLVDAAGNVSTRLFGPATPAVAAPEYTALVMREGLAGWVARQRRPALVRDTAEDDRFITLPSQRGPIRSAVSVPIVRGPRLVGVLTLVDAEAGHFEDRHLELLLGAADQIALALLNAQHVETLQLVIRSSHDGILFFDTDGRLVIANETALRLLDIPVGAEGLTGRRAAEIWPPLAPGPRRALQEALAETGDAGAGEFESSRLCVAWTSNRIAAPDSAPGRLIVLHDVTSERELERMREELTRTMVHDLRGPVSVILSALEIARTSTGSAPDMLVRARRAAEELNELIDGILDVSRLEQGSFPMERRETSIDAVVAQALETAAPVAQRKRQTLGSALHPETPPAWADASLVARVLHNLIGNALKFTPEGGRILIAAAPEPGAADLIRVSVEDDGPGIPESVRERLFERFSAGDQPGSGTGLGLAFCRLAVEAQDGRIWLEPRTGGSTIAFTLPTAASVVDEAARATG